MPLEVSSLAFFREMCYTINMMLIAHSNKGTSMPTSDKIHDLGTKNLGKYALSGLFYFWSGKVVAAITRDGITFRQELTHSELPEKARLALFRMSLTDVERLWQEHWNKWQNVGVSFSVN